MGTRGQGRNTADMFVELLLLITLVQDTPNITPTQPEPARDSSAFLLRRA